MKFPLTVCWGMGTSGSEIHFWWSIFSLGRWLLRNSARNGLYRWGNIPSFLIHADSIWLVHALSKLLLHGLLAVMHPHLEYLPLHHHLGAKPRNVMLVLLPNPPPQLLCEALRLVLLLPCELCSEPFILRVWLLMLPLHYLPGAIWYCRMAISVEIILPGQTGSPGDGPATKIHHHWGSGESSWVLVAMMDDRWHHEWPLHYAGIVLAGFARVILEIGDVHRWSEIQAAAIQLQQLQLTVEIPMAPTYGTFVWLRGALLPAGHELPTTVEDVSPQCCCVVPEALHVPSWWSGRGWSGGIGRSSNMISFWWWVHCEAVVGQAWGLISMVIGEETANQRERIGSAAHSLFLILFWPSHHLQIQLPIKHSCKWI